MSVSMGGFSINDKPIPIYAFGIAVFLMFVIGLGILLRGSLPERNTGSDEPS